MATAFSTKPGRFAPSASRRALGASRHPSRSRVWLASRATVDSLRTDVTQSVRIRLEHSIGVVASFSHSDSGEGAFLIYGSFYEAGDNTCFYGF
jgi:hypothetical protein